jgi:uncharacterized membrane protein YjjP (DUF1212 family)
MDDAGVRQRLELLGTLALAFLECGQSTTQTAGILARCAAGLGLRGLRIDIFGTHVTLESAAPDRATITWNGRASVIDAIDCERLRDLNGVVASLGRGDDLTEALASVRRARAWRSHWLWSVSGLTLLAFFISLQVGVDWTAWVAAAAVQLVTALTGVAAGRLGVPRLFGATLQTTLGGLLAVALVHLGLVDPVGAAAALAVSWLLVLPLPQVVASITDAIDGEYLAALIRMAGVGVVAGGIFIGGSIVLYASSSLGLETPPRTEFPDLPWYLGLLFAALGAIANAFANGGRFALVLPAAVLGIMTSGVNQILLLSTELHSGWTASLSAAVLGAIAVLLARPTGYPFQVLALMGITGALLPGLTVYRGILREMSGTPLSGLEFFAQAGGTCLGLGIGAAAGVYLLSAVRGAAARTELPEGAARA